MKVPILLVVVAMLSASAARAEIVLSTLIPNPNTAFFGAGPSREPNPQQDFYSGGQTFIAPDGATTLHSFSIVVQHQDFLPPGSPWGTEAPAQVRGAVMQFNGNTAVGDVPLFLSSIVTIPINGFATQKLTFDTGNLPVTAGTQYGVFITKIDINQAGLYRILLPISTLSVTATPATNARAAFSNATSFAEASGDVWTHFAPNSAADTQFEARFNVPEPSTALISVVSLFGLVRRRKAAPRQAS